jgi:hypothetical protein
MFSFGGKNEGSINSSTVKVDKREVNASASGVKNSKFSPQKVDQGGKLG